MEKTMDKAIITVVGKDTVGIIAKVCTYLADNGVNVLDISQTIVSGFFNMMMIVDMADAKKHFAEISAGGNRSFVFPPSIIRLQSMHLWN